MILNNYQNLKRSSILFISAGIFVIILGIVSIIGWFLNLDVLKSDFPSYTTIKFNTALCFIVAGCSFLLLIKFKYNNLFLKSLFRLITVCLGAFAIISFSQNVFHYSAGVDQLFMTDYNSIAGGLPFPGRMSPSTSLCFSLLAISFLLIPSKGLAYRNIAQYFLHTITLISFISLIGYLFKVPYSYKFSFFSTMALNTGIAFLLLSMVASLINYDLGLTSLFTGKGIGNIMARRLFPGMIIILVVRIYKYRITAEKLHYYGVWGNFIYHFIFTDRPFLNPGYPFTNEPFRFKTNGS